MSCFQSPILNGTNRSITFNLIMLSRQNEAKKKTLKLLNNIMWRIYLTVLGKEKTNGDSPGVLTIVIRPIGVKSLTDHIFNLLLRRDNLGV